MRSPKLEETLMSKLSVLSSLLVKQRRPAVRAVAVALSMVALAPSAQAQIEPYIGQIMCAGFNFTPRGWAPLNGQLVSIQQNSALFSLLGTYFGGDGVQTFALPDARGRMVLHTGQAPGRNAYQHAQTGGSETTVLQTSQLPAHVHAVAPRGSSAIGTLGEPGNAVPAAAKKADTRYAAGPGDVAMSSTTTAPTGGNQPIDKMPPYLAINCFIAVQGIFPSRD
jgi:microcystin-dependent protein